MHRRRNEHVSYPQSMAADDKTSKMSGLSFDIDESGPLRET